MSKPLIKPLPKPLPPTPPRMGNLQPQHPNAPLAQEIRHFAAGLPPETHGTVALRFLILLERSLATQPAPLADHVADLLATACDSVTQGGAR